MTGTRTGAGPAIADAYDRRPWLGAYPPGVPADVEAGDLPLTALLDDAARHFPSRTAIAFLGSQVSYRRLHRLVDRFAAGLAAAGVRQGDRVAVVLPNCPQTVITFFAVLRLGAVVVLHNPLYTEPELRRQLTDCGASVAVVWDRSYPVLAAARAGTAVRRVVVTSLADLLPARRRLALALPLARARMARAQLVSPLPVGAEVLRFTDLLVSRPRAAAAVAGDAPGAPPAPEVPAGLAVLQYTGGTTGRPKGAMLTHRSLLANARQAAAWLPDARPGEETVLGVLPLFHVYGLTTCLGVGTLLAATVVLLPRFDLTEVLTAIVAHRVTLLPGVPPIYQAIVDSPKTRRYDLSSVKACLAGAMRLSPDLQRDFERITGGRLAEGYGMTETSPITVANPLAGQRRPGSIGIPVPSTYARIVDPDDPTAVRPPGEVGELAVRGPQVFAGYWHDPAETARVLTPDGWLLTGDIAVMGEDGWFTVVDRKKELIIAGGFNIFPSEVEDALRELPGVADCAVVGIPDAYRGETVKAYVVPAPGAKLTEAEVREHCRARLTAYKVPRLVEFRTELPRSDIGKVLRRSLVGEELAGRRPAP